MKDAIGPLGSSCLRASLMSPSPPQTHTSDTGDMKSSSEVFVVSDLNLSCHTRAVHDRRHPVCQGSLVTTLKEVRPTAFMGVPRVWEKMQEKMKSVGAKSSTVRRKLAIWAKDVGLQTNLTKMNQYVDALLPSH